MSERQPSSLITGVAYPADCVPALPDLSACTVAPVLAMFLCSARAEHLYMYTYVCVRSQTELPSGFHAVQAEEPGLAVFDGGSYSRGPLQLGVLPSSIIAASTSAATWRRWRR